MIMRTIMQRLHRIVCQLHVFLQFLRFYSHTCLATILTGFAHCLSLLHVMVGSYAQCLGITGQSAFWTLHPCNTGGHKQAKSWQLPHSSWKVLLLLEMCHSASSKQDGALQQRHEILPMPFCSRKNRASVIAAWMHRVTGWFFFTKPN